MERKIKYVANAVRWFDKVNGNTYHSVNITSCKTAITVHCPFGYGYGDQYRYTALKKMADVGWIPKRYAKYKKSGSTDLFMYERENNYPILWNVSDGKKRDCIANGKA